MDETQPLLSAREVVRRYPERGRRWGTGGNVHPALDGATLAFRQGEILGLVGRSGAGKTTLARVLLGLERAEGGETAFRGEPLGALTRSRLRALRREVQAVFQDPLGALDPRQPVLSIVTEPLAVMGGIPRAERRGRAARALRDVGLPVDPDLLHRRPWELSGGERQRVAIARAIVGAPAALVLDEPVSALDVSVRGQVLNLLLDLHRRAGLSLLVIAHDLTLVAGLCTRVAVMSRGRVVEEGPALEVLARPESEEGRELLAAARSLTGVGTGPARSEPSPAV